MSLKEMKDISLKIIEISLTQRLLSALSPSGKIEQNPRRFTCLGRLLTDGEYFHLPDEKREISDEEKAKIRASLLKKASSLPTDDRLKIMRTFAILYWDWAKEYQQEHGDGDKKLTDGAKTCYSSANFLWRLILTDSSLRNHFTREHDIGDTKVTEETYKETCEKVVDEILRHHLEWAKEWTRKSDLEGARFHYKCLCGWDRFVDDFFREHPKILRIITDPELWYSYKTLELDISTPIREVIEEAILLMEEAQTTEEKMKYRKALEKIRTTLRWLNSLSGSFDSDEAGTIQKRSNDLISEWVSDILSDANKHLNNPDIDSLPQGISKDFEGALFIVEPAIEVMHDNRRLLLFSVKQRNEWGYQLAIAKHHDQAREIIEKAISRAGTLAEKYLREGDSLEPDNQAVYLTYSLAWQLEEQHDKVMGYLEQCKRWGGKEEEIKFQMQRQLIHQAIEEERYGDALNIIDSMDSSHKSDEQIKQLRAACYFKRGINKAGDANIKAGEINKSSESFFDAWLERRQPKFDEVERIYRDAYEDMCRAEKLVSSNERDIIAGYRKQLEEVKDEVRYHIILNAAHKILEDGKEKYFMRILSPLETVPDDSEAWESARAIGSNLHFQIGVNLANKSDYSSAEIHMQKALELNPYEPLLKSQMSGFYEAYAYWEVKQANDKLDSIASNTARFIDEYTDRSRGSDLSLAERNLKSAVRHIKLAYENALSSDPKQIQRQLLDMVKSIGADIPLDKLMEKLDTKKSLMKDMEHIEEAYKDIRINLLVRAAHNVIEKDAKKHYKVFIRLLENVPKSHRQIKIIDQLLAGFNFRLGIQEANNGNYRKAIKYLEDALSFDPGNKVIKEQLEMVRRIMSEEEIVKKFIKAQKEFESGNYEEARRLTESIPRDFSHYNEVRQFLGVVYFKLGEKAISTDMDEAIRYLDEAVEMTEHHPDVVRLRDMLKAALRRRY